LAFLSLSKTCFLLSKLLDLFPHNMTYIHNPGTTNQPPIPPLFFFMSLRSLKAEDKLLVENATLRSEVDDLTKLTQKMEKRLSELERNSVLQERDCANARHVALLFEEFVTCVTKENAAILKSHSNIKQEMETCEKMIAYLAEKMVNMVSDR